jgi:hypothetical protein
VIRYTRGSSQNGFSLTGLAYHGRWTATDQIPQRAVRSGQISRFGNLDATDGGHTSRYSAVAEHQRTSGDTFTRATGFLSRYELNLFSNFTYALADPVGGDQFEQVDRRASFGGRVSQVRRLRWNGRLGENTYGIEVRNDRIPVVGFYSTSARARFATVREDDVTQSSAAVFFENSLRWSSWLRTTAGLRWDGYRFSVASNEPANSGLRRAALASPKAGVVLGPWRSTELYVNAGTGFHSNDARGTTITRDPLTGDAVEPVTPLVRVTGAEFGFRTVAIPRVQTTLSVWGLGLASELVFVGDAGTTEAGRPSDRWGVEWSTFIRVTGTWTADADVAWSHARFRDTDPAGRYIPGAPAIAAAAGIAADTDRRAFGGLRLRYFGPRPLIEDNSQRSTGTTMVNAQLGYHLSSKAHILIDAFNVLDARASDIDYFYRSRLPGEPAEGLEDIHTHPALPRTVRLVLRWQF